ncbi:MAG: hypothetical protein H8K07_05400 [Nitrospira sp.]|nr:hypothetical protein [Nitrospira sp.]
MQTTIQSAEFPNETTLYECRAGRSRTQELDYGSEGIVSPLSRVHGADDRRRLRGRRVGVLDWSELPGWRCINYGERVDPLILANRRGAEEEGTMKDKRFRSGVNGHDRGEDFFEKISRSSEQAAPMKRSEKGCRL